MQKEAEGNSTQDILDGLNVDVNRILPVPEKAYSMAYIKGSDSYAQMYRESIDDTCGFWDKVRLSPFMYLGTEKIFIEGRKRMILFCQLFLFENARFNVLKQRFMGSHA